MNRKLEDLVEQARAEQVRDVEYLELGLREMHECANDYGPAVDFIDSCVWVAAQTVPLVEKVRAIEELAAVPDEFVARLRCDGATIRVTAHQPLVH